METDELFKTKLEKSTDFKFDANVVDVFDDMVVRSVPYYLEFQRMITEITKDFAKQNSNVYDLGCSTGTTFLMLNNVLDQSIHFVGVDESIEMIETCRKNVKSANMTRSVELISENINKPIKIENASVVILCLTLQFVRPLKRQKLLKTIYEQLNPGGCIILIEKVLSESPEFTREFIKYYYDFKRRNNYGEMEIAQKRESLENVLIPYKLSENIEMLIETGFSKVEVFFKWYNFAGIVAVK